MPPHVPGEFSNLIGCRMVRQQVFSLDEIRETGYEGSELGDWGFYAIRPRRVKMRT